MTETAPPNDAKNLEPIRLPELNVGEMAINQDLISDYVEAIFKISQINVLDLLFRMQEVSICL